MRIICLTIGFLIFTGAASQKITDKEYISIYKDLAITEMKRTGIPASITLAQGMLESGNGNSSLAIKGNNHFGIKCHSWQGGKIYHDDDKKNECFRKYKSAYESYMDHSDFLTNTNRYGSLFELNTTDYKGWAKGLKKAGYATANDYDRKLIDLIERHKLYEFDHSTETKDKSKSDFNEYSIAQNHTLQTKNNVKYIIAKDGDTYEGLTEEFDMMRWQLARYNEMPQNRVIKKGDIIYLQPKRKKAAHGIKHHTVKEGETMYGISQLYAIKLNELHKKNLIPYDQEAITGTVLSLRKSKKGKMPIEEIENNSESLEFEFE